MKKNVLAVIGLTVLSTQAFASKARMEALGQGSHSYYLMDSRSVFLNAASVNEVKNYITTEWGASVQADSSSAPRAEGGFFREMGAFNYGLYLGNNGDARTYTSTSSATFLQHTNALDLVLGGDMGMKWGARLHYANAKDESGTFTKKNSALGVGLGLIHGDIQGYANITISDKSEGAKVAGDMWKRKPGFQVGASYKWSGMTFFADYNGTNEEISAATGSDLTNVASIGASSIAAGSTVTRKANDITVGASKVHELTPGARLITDARLVLGTTDVSGSSTAAFNGKTKNNRLPVTFAMEADATSWLTLRGSVSQNVFLGETKSIAGKSVTTADSTTVNAGATLNFGKLKVDGVIGRTAGARNGTVAAAGTNEGVLATDNLMTRVGVTYNF